jgi:tetratricopeptide (TPR) repeat protein
MLRGEFARGEHLAREGAALGERVQSEVARQILAGHLGFLRETQGPIAELEAPIKALADRHPAAPIWRANLAHIYAQLGRTAEARREFETVAGRDFSDVPHDLRWLPIMTLLAQAGAALGDRHRAPILYDLLRPYAGRFVAVASGAGPCMGAVSRSLGLLATALSRWPEAERHFQDALAASARVGARPWVAVVQRDHARLLLTRDGPGDRDQARQLLAAALASARELGMARLRQSVESADRQASASAVPAGDGEGERPPTRPRARGDVPRTAGRPPAAVRSGNAFQLDGEFWTLEYQHVVRRLKDARGLRYLAALVHAPEREFHVLDLAALTAHPVAPGGRAGLERNRGRADEDLPLRDGGDAGPPLDARARDAYRQRVKDLEGDVEEAERFHDPERAARAGAEIEFIRGQLAGAYGLHGRPRRVGAADEQARKNVTNCIRDSLRRIEQAHPALGRHLRRSIKTGILCSYRPEQPTAWDR